MKKNRSSLLLALMLSLSGTIHAQEQAPFPVGANFLPSTAVNQLEMWQAATFDTTTISRELGYAADMGMNCMRVYLHHVAWKVDRTGFLERMSQYLDIAGKHGIRTMFVFFDDCWRDRYAAGPQPAPVPGVHNSQWLKDPGVLIDEQPLLMDTLKMYVKDVLATFAKDNRIMAWDLYNEPGHFGHGDKSWPLLRNVVQWAKEVKPAQPLTIGLYNPKLVEFNQFQLENSDIITVHNYKDTTSLKAALDTLTKMGKPVILSEYMKRPTGSTFEYCLPILKRYGVGAINWGLVAGKSQTNYPQGNKGGEPEPATWFHDILRKDGTPFDPAEVETIRKMTGKSR